LLLGNLSLFAQSDFTIRWSSEVGCLTYGENREKEIPLEDIENDKCVKVCEDSTVMFELMFDSQNQQVDDITWSIDGGDITNTSPDQTQINVQWPTVTEDASVNVEILKSDGEIILSRLCIEVTPKPEAFFEIAGLENEFYCEDTDLYFNNLSTTADGSNIVSHIWDFGNGDFSNAENPVYSYNEAGEYQVTLTVRDECNCVNRYTQIISVLPPAYQIECPTVTCENAIETYFIEVNPEAETDKVDCSQFNWSVDGGEIIEQEENWVSILWNEVDESGFGTVYFDQSDCDVECNTVLAARIPVVQEQGTIQGGKTELCEGEQSVFSLPQWPTTDFQWMLFDNFGTAYPNNTFLTDQRNEIAVGADGLAPGNYTLKASYTNTLHNCSGNAEIDIEILESLEIQNHPDKSCEGSSVTFTLVNATSNAQWSISKLGVSVASSTGSSINYNFTEAGVYDIMVSKEGFCTTTSSIEIFENPSFPVGTAIDGDDEICPNQLLTYTLDPFISEGNILWSVTNGEIIGSNIGTEVSVIFNESATNFQITAQLFNPNLTECLSDPIQKNISLFTVNKEITNVDSGSTGNQTFCASSLSEFILDYQDSDFYSWTFDPPELATVSAGQGTNNPTILFNETFTDQAGNLINQGEIIVNAKVCGQMQEIDRFDFNILESPTLTVTTPASICAGEQFSVDITSDIPLDILNPQDDISIIFEGVNIQFNQAVVNSPTSFTITDVALDDIENIQTIAYNVSVNSESCNPATASGTIVVTPKPEANISILSGSNVFCDPQDINTVFESSIQNPDGNETYQWLYNGFTPISGPGATSPILDVGDLDNNIYNFGSYRLEVTNAEGCKDITNSIQIIQNCTEPPPCNAGQTVTVSTDWSSCDEVKVTVNYSGNPVSVEVTATDSFSTVNSTLINTDSNPQQSIFTFRTNATGNYNFRIDVLYNNCLIRLFEDVNVGYKPILNAEISCSGSSIYDVVLNNDSTFLTAFGNLNPTYQITNIDTGQNITPSSTSFEQATATLSPANYEFTLSIQQPGSPLCVVTEQVDLSLPDASFSIANSNPFCTEEPVILSPTNPDPDVTYLWEFQGATNTQQDISIQMLDEVDAFITLTATNAYGCSSSFSIENLEVLKAEFDGAIQPNNPLLCQGENVDLFYNTPIGGTVPSGYQWLKDGEDIQGATNPTYTANTAGNYSVRLTDTDGCVYNELSGVFVNIAAPPSAVLFETDSTICQDESFNINGHTTPENSDYQIELIHDGQTTIVQDWTPGPDISYTHSFDDTGNFEFIVNIRDNNTNCQASESILVDVLPVPELQLQATLQTCSPYQVRIDVLNPSPNALYTWSNGMQGSSIIVDTGGPYRVNFQPESGCATTASINVPKSPDEFLWIFPDGCFEYCDLDVRQDPPYIIGPIPPFHNYVWDLNNTGTTQNGQVQPYDLSLNDGILNLSLNNDFNCTVTSPDLDLKVIACRENCNIEMFIDDIKRIEEGSFINYSLQGGFHNANNFPITITLNSNNGVFVPSVFSVPANSSISFGPGNPLIFIPDANFTGGVDDINIEGQNAGIPLCLQEMTIEYPMLQTRARAELKATPNAVEHTTALSYELIHIKNLGQADIEVYNMLGYLMDKRTLKKVNGTLNLNMTTYSSGKYIVVLKHNGQILKQLLLIKK
jgi:PKD repeat protein